MSGQKGGVFWLGRGFATALRLEIQVRRGLGQTGVVHLHVAGLALDDTERVLHYDLYAGLDALDLIRHYVYRAQSSHFYRPS
jgi:hypothetical protein